MKKMMMLLTAVVISLVSLTANAQKAGEEYFVGKWDVLTLGTPSGDDHSILILTRGTDGKLTGSFQSKGKEPAKFTRVEEKKDEITCYFVASGYDVYLFLKKTDKDNMEGSMMDMFDATAKRIVEKEKK